MLKPIEELNASVYNSRMVGGKRSRERVVLTYQLELFCSGDGISHVDGVEYPTARGMLLCAKPGMSRYSDFPVHCSYIHIRAGVDSAIDRILAAAPLCVYIEDEEAVERLMAQFTCLSELLLSAHAPTAYEVLRINEALLGLLAEVSAVWYGGEGEVSHRRLHRLAREACAYMDLHYRESCTLAVIAEALHASPNYLHTVFVRELEMTPSAAVTERRIRRAKHLIAAGELSMLEIAFEVGFCSQSHFNRVFKAEVGVTPAVYRRELLDQY